MRIAICEDDYSEMEQLSKFISVYMTQHNIKYQLKVFPSGEEFLEDAKSTSYDIAFLDIYLQELTGIDTATRLKQFQSTRIIFTTSSKEHAIEAFSLSAVHYLVKPLSIQLVSDALDRCHIVPCQEPFITIKSNQIQIPILQKHIIYIEIIQKTCYIYTSDQTTALQTKQTLSNLSDELTLPFFMQPHRSYIVNMNYIDSISPHQIILTNATTIPVSRNVKEICINEYEAFLLKRTTEVM